jgi:hypothetical protein
LNKSPDHYSVRFFDLHWKYFYGGYMVNKEEFEDILKNSFDKYIRFIRHEIMKVLKSF